MKKREQARLCRVLSSLGVQAGEGTPNLDCAEWEDLLPFTRECRYWESRLTFFGLMYPKVCTWSDFQKVGILTLLADYASIKTMALQFRANGDIEIATQFEGSCEVIYKMLPLGCRW